MGCPESLTFLKQIEERLKQIFDSLQKMPDGFQEDWLRFKIENVGEVMVSTQLNDMATANEYVFKDVEVAFSGTVAADAYLDVNRTNTNTAGARLGGRYYSTLSALHWDANTNGNTGTVLTSKPFLQLSAGTGMVAQTVYCTVHYFYKNK